LFCLAVLVAGASANAATITESDAFSVGTFASGASTTENLAFADFNSSLGTLTGVSVQYTVNSGAYAALEFANPFGNPGEAFSSGSVTGTLLTLANAGDGVNLATGAPFADVSVASGTILPTLYTVLPGVSSSAPITTSGSGTTAGFIGTGTQTLVLTLDGATSGATFANGTEYFVGHDGFAAGTAVVTYTYTPSPVPLPATVWLLLAGLGGFGLLNRKKLAA
jgi:hypothetical protein